MGWSCRADAGRVMDRWTDACVKQTGSQNVFVVKGVRYLWEVSRTEHADGAITGTVHRFVSETHAKKSGTFRIEGDGEITRAPKFLKDAAS